MRGKKVTVSVLLSWELNEKLKALAAGCGRTRSAYIRQILRRYLRYVETRDDPEGPRVDWEI